MNPGLATFCDRLLEALFNGGYQGLLLAGAVAVVLKCLRQVNSATRHLVWWMALLLVVALPAIHLVVSTRPNPLSTENHFGPESEAGRRATCSEARQSPRPNRLDFLPDHLSAGGPTETAADEIGNRDRAERNSVSRSIAAAEPPGPGRGARQPGGDGLFKGAGAWPASLPPERRPAMSPLRRMERLIAQTVQWLKRFHPKQWHVSPGSFWAATAVGIWLSLGLARLSCLAWQCFWLRRLKARGIEPPETMRILFENLSKEMGIRRQPRLLISQENAPPMTLGFRKPAVLLPSAFIQRDQEAELVPILRHELAHVARADDWTNLIQQILARVFFFHPAVWWISSRLSLEREIACDDFVLARQAPRDYARFLTDFASRQRRHRLTAAPAAWSNKHQLRERINMILDSNRNISPQPARGRAGLVSLAAGLIGVVAFYAGPRLVFAGEKSPPGTPASTQDATAEKAAPFSLDTESGPRSKPALAPAVPKAAAPLALPPEAPVPPEPPANVSPGQPGALPAPPAASLGDVPPYPVKPRVTIPRRTAWREDAIERRLARLEKMVEDLAARVKGSEKFKEGENKFNELKLNADKLSNQLNADIGDKVSAIVAQAMKEAERGVREAERAVREAERATTRESAKRRLDGSAIDDRRHALEQQRNALEKQLGAIDRQIKELEAERQKLEGRAGKSPETIDRPE